MCFKVYDINCTTSPVVATLDSKTIRVQQQQQQRYYHCSPPAFRANLMQRTHQQQCHWFPIKLSLSAHCVYPRPTTRILCPSRRVGLNCSYPELQWLPPPMLWLRDMPRLSGCFIYLFVCYLPDCNRDTPDLRVQRRPRWREGVTIGQPTAEPSSTTIH